MRALFGFLFIMAVSASQSERPPFATRDDEKTSRKLGVLTDAQIDDIVQFVHTVDGIDRHVLSIDATSPQVQVHTGHSLGEHGDLVYIEKRGGQWKLIRVGKWRVLAQPFVHEEQD